jgi:hypothetical protein
LIQYMPFQLKVNISNDTRYVHMGRIHVEYQKKINLGF